METCGIVFKDGGKVYKFSTNDIILNKDDYVIVDTEKGQQLGKVSILIEELSKKSNYKPVLRKASKVDYDKHLKNLSDAKGALIETRKIVESLNLKMQIIDANYTFNRKKLLFNFMADERIDFRELVKILAGEFKTRIELHQVGVRDKAKEIGGIGQCGRALCCSSFLNHIETISINMAKNQNIALNPSKINGACGRLLCCLSYEDSQYTESRKNLPKIGNKVKVGGLTGKVVSVDILNRKYKVQVNDEIKEIEVE